MTTNHIKAILTSLRAMVVKMLPAYKFYLGSTTETVTTQICHGVMSVEDGETGGDGDLTLDDASFAGFVEGETYTVVVNGVSGEYVAKPLGDAVFVTNAVTPENPSEDYWAAAFIQGACMYIAEGSYANAAISISQAKTITTKKYQTKKLDKSLLPNGIESRINTAYTTAESAQTTANSAQSTANTAKTTADAAAPKSNPVFSGSFSQNRKPDTVVGSYSHAEGYITTASGSYSHTEGYDTTASGYGSHAEGSGTTASGAISHVQGKHNIEDTDGKYAHIVGNGIDNAARSNAHTLDWSGNAWFAGTIEGKALILPSSTSGSTKKFKITVDDTGTLTATEVTSA